MWLGHANFTVRADDTRDVNRNVKMSEGFSERDI